MPAEKKFLCVGLCVLDIVHVCGQFPDEDSDKRCLQGHLQRGGNASNNCTVLRNLGAPCEFLGVLSNSEGFVFLREDCRKRSIDTQNCPVVEQDPPFSSVILSLDTKTRTIVHSNPNFPILKYSHFTKINLEHYKWIHFEARNPEETGLMIEDILKYNSATQEPIKISLDLEKLKTENLILAELVDVVFLGKDLAIFLGWNDLKTAVHLLRNMMKNKKCIIICAWGSCGSAVLDQDDNYYHEEAYPPETILDTLGAGDTFCAATIFGLADKNLKPAEAIKFGNKVAGYKLSSYGYDHISKDIS